ncbi:MAG: TetR family transcriptional regulator C-terminal domain-containing protein [Proteobacteria bacterium]|nr:TetR family transcriptional regulator C-terminal domain-containing protein [Pseudomonadota bacterium]
MAAPRRPGLRRDRLRLERERRLIEAALESIATLGLRETTVQVVARRAGMAVGSISQYFSSKEHLLTASLQALSEEFEVAGRERLATAGSDPAVRLARFVGCYFDARLCQRRKIAVWFAFWGEVKARPQYRAVCDQYDRRHDETLAQLCAALEAPGAGLTASAAAKLIASTCHGLWLEYLTGRDGLGRRELAALAGATLAALYPARAAALSLAEAAPGRDPGD